MESELTDRERERYLRQFGDDGVGEAGQARLKESRVLVVGAGGAGSAAAGHLAAAGVGHLGIADGAVVTLSDLPRQLLHFTPDVGAGKADSLALKLGFLNPETQADPYPVEVGEANAPAVIEGFDVVIDCTGNTEAGLTLSAACEAVGTPLVRAGAGALGPTLTGALGPASAGERAAIPGALAGIRGALAALEAAGLLLGGRAGMDGQAGGTVSQAGGAGGARMPR